MYSAILAISEADCVASRLARLSDSLRSTDFQSTETHECEEKNRKINTAPRAALYKYGWQVRNKDVCKIRGSKTPPVQTIVIIRVWFLSTSEIKQAT